MTEPTISGEDASRLIRGVLELCASIIPPEQQAAFFAGLHEEVARRFDEDAPPPPHLRVIEGGDR
jgi:uncharacterized protein (DUF2267 family)